MSSSNFVSPYCSTGPYYEPMYELESHPVPSRPPSPAIQDEIELLEPDKHDRDCFYARVVYRTFRSWNSPASLDSGTPWDGNKCPLESCSSRFTDVSSMLTHLEAECEALRDKVDKACSQARSTQAPTQGTAVSQVAENPSESQPQCRKCHSTWCRTKSLFENNKSLKRFGSLRDSFIGRRKRSPPPDTTGKVLHGPRTLEPVEAPDGQVWELGGGSWELGGGSWELEGRPVSPPVELPASSPIIGDSRPGPMYGTQSTPSKSSTAVSDMSETSTSTFGRDSLISVYSRPSVSSSSTTLSLPPISTTAKPLDDHGPIYAESMTLSPVDTENGDFFSEVSFSSGPRGDTPVHVIKPLFSSSTECPSSVGPEDVSPSSGKNQQQSYLPGSSITATEWYPDQASTNPGGIDPKASISSDQAFFAKLEHLTLTLSNLRKSEKDRFPKESLAGSIQNETDDAVLFGALDTFEKLLMRAEEDRITFKLCFAYLSLAMAVEIGQSVSEIYHIGLRKDFKQFVDTSGNFGLTWRFLDVAKRYLSWLHTHNPIPNHNPSEADNEEARRAHVNFRVMKDYLRQHRFPRLPSPSRQNSYSSTASTLVNDGDDIQVPPRTRSPSRTTSYDSTLSTSADPVQEATRWSRTKASPGKWHGDEPAEISCQDCRFFPDAPGQQKKLTRHFGTRKHSRMQARFAGRAAALEAAPRVTTSPIRRDDGVFTCPHRRADGSPCQSKFTKFTRKDNFKTHLKKQHPDVNPESIMRGGRMRREGYHPIRR